MQRWIHGALVVLGTAGGARAAEKAPPAPKPCVVKNGVDTYSGASAFVDALAAASDGQTLMVSGVCPAGGAVVESELTLIGSKSGATLDLARGPVAGGHIEVRGRSVGFVSMLVTHGSASDAGGAIAAIGEVGAMPVTPRLTLSGMTFRDNTAEKAGGAVFTVGYQVTVARSLFEHNAAYAGGALLVAAAGAVVSDSTFRDNGAQTGGGMAAYFTNVAVNRTVFESNRATYGGGFVAGAPPAGLASPGAPVAADGLPTFVSLTNCVFRSNHADELGGGVAAEGEPWLVSVNSVDTTYENNDAGYAGGAGAFFGASVSLTGAPLPGRGKGKPGQSRVLGNVVLSPEGGGGGFLFIESPVAISNTLFKANADGSGPTGSTASWFSTGPIDLSGDGNVIPPGTTTP